MKLTVEEIKAVIKDKVIDLVIPEHDETGHHYRHMPSNQVFDSVTTKSGILDAPHLKKWAAGLAADYLIENKDALLNHNKEDIEQLRKGAIMAHKDVFEDAGDIGTKGHDIIDVYLKEWINTNRQPKDIKTFVKGIDSRLWAITRSAEMFCNDFYVVPIASELFVASIKHGYAGTLDSLMMVARNLNRIKKSCDPMSTHFYLCTSKSRNQWKCRNCGQEMVLEFTLVDWKTANSINKLEYAMQVEAYSRALYEMTGLRCKNLLIVRLDKSQAKYEVMKLINRPATFRAFKHTSKVYDWLNAKEAKLAPIVAKERVSIYQDVV